MKQFIYAMLRRLAAGLLATALLWGCAAVEVRTHPDHPLSGYDSSALQAPEPDPLKLAPLVAAELRRLGLPPAVGEAPLTARFSYAVGEDIDAEGEICNGVRSLRLELHDAALGARVATADFAAGLTPAPPAEAVAALFARLRKGQGSPLAAETETVKDADKVSPPSAQEAQPSGGGRSPWVPRLESLGLESWGRDDQ